MESYLIDWTHLLLRWLHVIAAVAWIGESIYFVMLDNSLHPPRLEEKKKLGMAGEMWAVHGGGFYNNQKYLTNPPELPDDLHWSFWKSYTTWLSGFALFSVMYLANASLYLANPASSWAWAAALTGQQAAGVAVIFLALGWVVYDQLCRRISPNMENDGVLSVAVFVMMVAVAWVAAHIFPGRAAFLITGAVMATSMSANVFFWIIPGQRRMVAAIKAGQPPNPLDGKRGKQRSVHNTYFTLPVVFLMISNHYAFTYSHTHSWLAMVGFLAAGALIRQYFVLRHSGRNVIALPVAGVAVLIGVGWLLAPAAATPAAKAVTVAELQPLLAKHCVSCHAAVPTQPGFAAPPAGVRLDDEREVRVNAARIKQAVATGYMPLGNLTGMNADERARIAAWSGQ